MASATGSHPDTGSSVRPLPGSSTTIRPAAGRRFSALKMPLLTERGFAIGPPSDGLRPSDNAGSVRPDGASPTNDRPIEITRSRAGDAPSTSAESVRR
jgi:hypothetical protein